MLKNVLKILSIRIWNKYQYSTFLNLPSQGFNHSLMISMIYRVSQLVSQHHNTPISFLTPNPQAWCDKLAYVASRNAARCEFKHDLCRNTDDFPHSGQNIASVSLSSGYRVDNDAIVQMIKMWSDESPDCPSDVIQAFRMPPAGAKQIGHFTQMVHGNCDRLGCALIRYHKSGEYYDTYLVCNYGETNMLREIVYEVGDTASACPDGKRSTKYSGLCRNAYARYDVAAATATAGAAASNGGAHASASSSNSVESTTAPSSGVVSVQVSTRTTPTSIVTTRTERHADGSVHTTVTTKAIKQQVVYVSSRSQSFVSTTTSSSNVFGNNNVVRSFSHKRTNL